MGLFRRMLAAIGLEIVFDGEEDAAVVPQASGGMRQRSAATSVTGNALAFDPHLITGLKADHQVLIGTFMALTNAVGGRNVDAAQAALLQFADGLTHHLMVENSKLYVYLKVLLNKKHDREHLDRVQVLKKEMDTIGGVVTRFIQSTTASLNSARPDWATMASELQAIGGALTTRIQTEERDLYTLYQAS